MTFLYCSGHFMKIPFSKLAVGVAKHGFSFQCLTFDVIPRKGFFSKLTPFPPP